MDLEGERPPPNWFSKTAPLGSAQLDPEAFGKALVDVIRSCVERECRVWGIQFSQDMVDEMVNETAAMFYIRFDLQELSTKEVPHRIASIISYIKKRVIGVVKKAHRSIHEHLPYTELIQPQMLRPLEDTELDHARLVAQLIRRALNRIGEKNKRILLQKHEGKEEKTFSELQQQCRAREDQKLTLSAYKMQYARAKASLLKLLLADEKMPIPIKKSLIAASGDR